VNTPLSSLFQIANKPTRKIIGLMSGTSLDGLDIVYCGITGSGMETVVDIYQFETVSYPVAVKDEIRKVFAKKTIEFEQLCLLNPWIAGIHAGYILQTLEQWKIKPSDVDLIASHGQTVYHCPRIQHKKNNFPNATLQIGDGDYMAVKTGIITISDFRQKHIAAGGEGAPLALYGDYCIFMKKGENRIMLNMGGIANFTFLPSSGSASEVFVTDTGPGNTLIDALAQKYFDKDFDTDGSIGRTGTVNAELLKSMKAEEFFSKDFPKTTGPEVFNLGWVERAQQESGTTDLSPEDLVATLTRLSAETISDALKKVMKTNEPYHLYTSGGGAHNPLLMQWIKECLSSATIHSTAELGVPGDAKEAILFAILANETIAGQPINFNRATMPAITMGKISFPY
jgi:anhydro-N-acetylmuramic acid kinase